MFDIYFTYEAQAQYKALSSVKLKKVQRAIAYLQENPRHPSLNTHIYSAYKNPVDLNEPVFEAYVENRTPGAYRIFWCYGPERGNITLIAMTQHP